MNPTDMKEVPTSLMRYWYWVADVDAAIGIGHHVGEDAHGRVVARNSDVLLLEVERVVQVPVGEAEAR